MMLAQMHPMVFAAVICDAHRIGREAAMAALARD
jgi:hypothetical protein